jgi:23S rRNA pseudouridine1911/1915/1917 synthase
VRLDRRLRELHPELSWTRIREAIERGQVLVGADVERDPAREVDVAAEISFEPNRPARRHARLDLPRLYEDDEILVIDKPAGLLTIATAAEARQSEDTALRRVQDYARHLHGRQGYAGVLHRLDRDTSGALAVALTREAHARGRALFAEHRFERRYLALVRGVPARSQGTIRAAVSRTYASGRRHLVRGGDEGRDAITHYRVRERLQRASLVELRLETGRQHQIRLHLQELGHPLLGERTYIDTPDATAPRQMLHAWILGFPHPLRQAHRIEVESPLPADFEKMLRRLRS